MKNMLSRERYAEIGRDQQHGAHVDHMCVEYGEVAGVVSRRGRYQVMQTRTDGLTSDGTVGRYG